MKKIVLSLLAFVLMLSGCSQKTDNTKELAFMQQRDSLESIIQQIYEFISKVRKGGRIIVPESTYCHLPYGIEGMEIIMRTAGLRVEMPLSHMPDLLIATVE